MWSEVLQTESFRFNSRCDLFTVVVTERDQRKKMYKEQEKVLWTAAQEGR